MTGASIGAEIAVLDLGEIADVRARADDRAAAKCEYGPMSVPASITESTIVDAVTRASSPIVAFRSVACGPISQPAPIASPDPQVGERQYHGVRPDFDIGIDHDRFRTDQCHAASIFSRRFERAARASASASSTRVLTPRSHPARRDTVPTGQSRPSTASSAASRINREDTNSPVTGLGSIFR